ncbi:hypothetical protein [Streptomyces sp. NPDC014622]|uniref:hypothetical protein n=1 Tax=Streptomyces sp. NPDC014622 TaxID=3364874 RepID=UPI0036F7A591
MYRHDDLAGPQGVRRDLGPPRAQLAQSQRQGRGGPHRRVACAVSSSGAGCPRSTILTASPPGGNSSGWAEAGAPSPQRSARFTDM